MNLPPIQIGPEGVLIPHRYLAHATEFEIELTDGYVLVRPKGNDPVAPEAQDAEKRPFPWVGIGHTQDPTASQHVEEILESEIDPRDGWTNLP